MDAIVGSERRERKFYDRMWASAHSEELKACLSTNSAVGFCARGEIFNECVRNAQVNWAELLVDGYGKAF